MSKISDVTQELQSLNHQTSDSNVILESIADEIVTLNVGLNSILDFLIDSGSGSIEERREQKNTNERLLAALEGSSGGRIGGQPVQASGDDEGGGFLGKFGLSGLGSAGAGIGLGAAGIGALFAGGGYLLDQIVNMDADALKDNIITLLSIPDEVGGAGDFFVKGGTFFVAMTGLGVGLAAFALGSGVAAAVDYFTEGNDFAENIKDNVLTLLSIPDELGGNLNMLAEGGAFFVAMTGLGVGLAAFALGSGVAAAVDYFTKDSNFAENIKENVKTLLSIPDVVGGNLSMLAKGGAFVAAMTGLGIGLAAFGAGSAAAGLSDALTDFGNPNWAESIKSNVLTLLSISDEVDGLGGALLEAGTFVSLMTGLAAGLALFSAGSAVAGITDGLTNFTNPSWAQNIKDNVLTLLSIEDDLGGKLAAFGESGTFFAIMSGLGAGLAAFGVGKTAVAIADTISKSDWTQTIKQNVADLLSITDMLDGDGEDSKAGRFAAGMSKIALGLLAFTGSKAIGMLGSVGEKVLGFFGADSPFDQIISVADNSDKLMQGAEAIERIASALNKFGNIQISTGEIDFEELAQNLGRSIPLLRGLAEGGEVGGGWFDGPNIDFGNGLLDPSLKLDELAVQVEKVNYVLGRSSSPPGSSPDSQQEVSSTDDGTNEKVEIMRARNQRTREMYEAQNERQELQEQRLGGGTGTNQTNVNAPTNISTSNSTVVKPLPSPSRVPQNSSDLFYGVGAGVTP